MEVTGYMLREQIKVRMLELVTLYARFEDQLLAFPGEDRDPIARAGETMKAEREIVLLQLAQKQYNMGIKVLLPGSTNKVPLEHIIKLVGPTARVAKHWRKASRPETSSYNRRNSTRKLDEIYEELTVPESKCLALAKELEKKAARMRSIIGTANATQFEIDWLDDSLFD